MRLSVIQTDLGYLAWLKRRDWLPTFVTLNGVLVQEVITADDERGEVVRVARDEWGRHVLDCDECVHETLRGLVRILPYVPSDPPKPDAGPGSRPPAMRRAA